MSLEIELDRKHVWHPFTHFAVSRPPICIQSGAGIHLYDDEGNQYLDMISSWWVNPHGHCHPRLNQALLRQVGEIEHVMFAGFTHKAAIDLSKKITDLMPEGLTKVFYSDNGSTAVEVAIKLAYQYWRNLGQPNRNEFIALKRSFHGDTLGAMSVGRTSGFYSQFEDLLFPVNFINIPEIWINKENIEGEENTCFENFLKLLGTKKGKLAALIIEPLVQGPGGMRMYRKELLERIMEKARDEEVLVIFDEIMTGFGRTGPLFVANSLPLSPDMVCLSKCLTGGYMPLALTIIGDQVSSAFHDEDFAKGFFPHGHSYAGNPLGCALALENLKIFEEEKVSAKIADIERHYEEYFHPFVHSSKTEKVRTCGTIAALNLRKEISYGSPFSKEIEQFFLQKGIILRPIGNVIYLMPPYCVTEKQIKASCEAIGEFLERL